MMNDRFSTELRQHLLATADERPTEGRFAAIVEGVAATAQRPAALAWLTWFPTRMGPFPSAAVRYGLIALALIVATVAAVALAGGQPPRSVDLGIFEPAAGRIVSGVWSVDPEAFDPSGTSLPTSLPMGPEEVLAVGWSSDGTKLLFMREDPTPAVPFARHLYVLHADGTETQLTTDGMEMWGATIAPDGSRVVYAARDVDAARSVPPSLYAVDAEGGQPIRIVEEGEQPTFSPDGSQIAYAVNNIGEGHVWVVDADGSNAHEILAGEPALLRGVDELRWSPTGDRIAMEDQGEGHVAIYTFAPDGSDFTKVIEGGMNAFWSPDGSQIAYLRPYDGPRPGLVIANADGSDVREFGFGASGPWHPGTPEDDVEEPTSPPPSTTPSADPTSERPRLGLMWPQSSPEEVRRAQERADAGDPAYTWQVDPQLSDDAWTYLEVSDPAPEIVDRFLRERLGWDEYLFLEHEGDFDSDGGDGAPDGRVHRRAVYMRCAGGVTNPLYPTASCAPTIDDLRFETISLDIVQPGEHGSTGIWVASVWRDSAPFVQTDPRGFEAEATARLEDFLAARVQGEGAEGLVEVSAAFLASDEFPLLYAATTGAPYERFEIERVSGPEWPHGGMDFTVRLFADGGSTVVEQAIGWNGSSLDHNPRQTTENGLPLAMPYVFLDGAVTMSAADPWGMGLERWALELGDQAGEAIVLVADPRASGVGCGIGAFPVDADALARNLQLDPDLEVTAPVAVTVGGIDALKVDLVMAPGAAVCDGASPVLRLPGASDYGNDRQSASLAPGTRMRLYLVDLPEGSASRIMAIAIVAPEARFDSVLEAATPIIDSIQFHAP
jgi:hypothetical protein